MKTRILTLIVSLFVTTMVFAYDDKIDGIYYNFDETNKTAEVTYRDKDYKDYSGDVVIPNTVSYNGVEYNVTSIGERAFQLCSSLASITIPSSVTSIGYCAFSQCYSLSSITIPNSVTSIGEAAFSSCSSLTSITIPHSVTSIENAFGGCEALTSVEWDAKKCNDFFSKSDAPFYYIRGQVKTFTFGDNVEYIPAYLCGEMSSLLSITIPNSVTSIGNSAFDGCSSLTSIEIPNSVTSIGGGAFDDCTGLTSIEIPNSVTSIGSWAFSGCESLSSVYISDIAAWCNIEFKDYDSNPLRYAKKMYLNGAEVTDLVILEGVDSIKNYAFSGCSFLTSITIPNSVTSIGESAFSGSPSLTSIKIPNSVTSIGHSAFSSCSSLTSIEIPNSVTSIGPSVFSGCSSLTSIEIPNSVTSIEGDAFSDCSSLTSIIIPNSVTSIGESAFYRCSSLASVTIGNSVTSIGEYAFYNCAGLKSIEIGNSVTSIEKYVFYGCISLTSVKWNVDSYDISSDTNTPFYYYEWSIGEQYDLRNQITSFTFGDSVRHIPARLCCQMDNLKSIEIPNSVISIGNSAFAFCDSLSSITIGNSVTSIGNSAFDFCSSLTSITIPNSVTSIGAYAFSNCSSLTSITIGSNVTSIGAAAFRFNENLDTITCLAITPPEVYGNDVFDWNEFVDDDNCLLLVPERSLNVYKKYWMSVKFKNIRGFKVKYTVSTLANDEKMGIVSGDGTYEEGTEITLTATTNEGYGFVKWSDGNTENPRKVIVSQDSTFTAIFSKAFTISTTVNNDAMGVVLGEGEYGEGCEITLTAKATEGYHFVKWSDGNTENPRTIVVTEDVELTAEFAINQYNVEVTSGGNGLVNNVNGVYNHGDTITLTATPNEHYYFVKWSDGNTENPRTIVVTEDVEFTAEFAINQYEVNVAADGNGTVTGSGTYDYGTEVTIEAKANEGYHFVEWSDGNTENPRTIVVTEDVEFTAEFAINQYEVNVAADGNGTVTGSGTYDYGTEVTIEAMANDGYHFVKWSDGKTENPRTIVVTEDVELTAEFELDGTPVDNVDESSVIVYVQDGMIYIEGADADYNVFDASGRLVYTGHDAQLSLPRGVYMVAVGGEVQKVIL